MPSALPLITLLTDFGERDWFVASMKGVILSINPAARIVDLSHHITPHRIDEAAYCLRSCYRYFPEGTVHVAVVDPGVGSGRRAILVKTARYYFVAPDNGLLTPIFTEEPDAEIWQLENRQYRLESQGATFHGRDVFAPAAAWLSTGLHAGVFGPPVSDPVTIDWPQPMVEGARVRGHIVYVDCFGNAISNITSAHVMAVQAGIGSASVTIRLLDHRIEGLVGSYQAGRSGAPCGLINSNGVLEVFVKEGSAASLLGVSVGAPIVISRE
ncbi:MAG: SAM-dependent chlorinase/fluorinase [Nitrospira sp.]|nr:SAM-dependent chlorinase/fluorinase [Nitrospira sp.]